MSISSEIIASNISTGLEQFINQLKRLNILWTLRTGTTTGDINEIHNVITTGVALDGDVGTITANSLIGVLAGNTRVFVLFVPPAGTYIIGRMDFIGTTQPYTMNNVIINNLLTINGLVQATNPTMKSVTNIQLADVTAFTNTTYQTGAVACGFTFVAPPSGAGHMLWHANIRPNTANKASLTIQIRTGTTIDSGTITVASDEDWSIGIIGAGVELGSAMHRPISGLTPGSSYNVVTQHKVSGGNATLFIRSVTWIPEW